MKKHVSAFYITSLVLAMSGCTPDKDMQGLDPNEYYSQHPIRNKVETRQISELVHFMPGQATLSDDERDKLRDGLHTISPPAVDRVVIRIAQDDKYDKARKDALVALMKRLKYDKIKVRFEPSASVKRGTAWIDVAYLVVVAPDCPDWRTSPITSYSNTWQGNSRCAEEVNLGLMVADPHDLVHGTGDVSIATERDSHVIQDYNSNKDYMPNTLNAGNSGGSGGSGSSGSSGGSMPGGSTSAVAAGTSGLTGSSQ